MNVLVTKLLMISAGERKGRTIDLKYMAWHFVHLL